MFSLATFCVLGSYHFLHRALTLDRARYWAGYVLTMVAGSYTLYSVALFYAAYLLGALFTATRKSTAFRPLLVSHALIIFLVAPWFLVSSPASSAGRVGVALPYWREALWAAHILVTGPLPPDTPLFKLAGLLLPSVACLAGIARVSRRPEATPLLLAALAPLAWASMVTFRGEPAVQFRRALLPRVVHFHLLASAGAQRIFPRFAGLPGVVVVGLNIWSLIYVGRFPADRFPFGRAVQLIKREAGPDPLFIAHPPWAAYAFLYYAERYGLRSPRVVIYRGLELAAPILRHRAPEEVWVISDLPGGRTPRLHAMLSQNLCRVPVSGPGSELLARYHTCHTLQEPEGRTRPRPPEVRYGR